ncbi:hypothetical protein SO802_020150 [Lithocarpus litseifolius]|uniref:Uncharacterized protein n=1 Tax=Lithocarpus litseifolius TaxID=425828 RepID=A0AAW2CF47_9ROSI
MAGKEEGPAVSIDLGTTYLYATVWQRDCVEIITNKQGNKMMPSYVAFTDNEHLIGDVAKNRVARSSTNSIFGVMGFIVWDCDLVATKYEHHRNQICPHEQLDSTMSGSRLRWIWVAGFALGCDEF